MTNTHKFTVDDNIINHLITHQAGSLHKALTELVMNSIDAKATKIIIEFNKTHFKIIDNGFGFKDKDEIIKFFGRFGTPHEEGDATFGRFRIGRGQIMAFGECTWRSSAYSMSTDIKNKGLTYDLRENLEPIEGCIVEGKFYPGKEWEENHRHYEFHNLIRDVEYLDIEIVMNGKTMTSRLADTAWEIENELFYFKPEECAYSCGSLYVYNQGVFVCEYPHKQVGRSGYLISKKRLEVNFARNAVLENECPVWKEILLVLKESVVKRRSFTKPILPEDRAIEYNMFRDGETHVLDFIRMRLLQDVKGNVFSFSSIDKTAADLTVADYDDIAWAEHLNNQPTCFVFENGAPSDFDPQWRKEDDRNPIHEMLNLVLIKAKEEVNKIKVFTPDWERLQEIISWAPRTTFYFYANGKALRQKYPAEKKPYPLSQCSPEEVVFFKEVSRANDDVRQIASKMLKRKGKIEDRYKFPSRKLILGDSIGSARGWTDGGTYIALDIGFFRESIKRNDSGVFEMILVIAHEYIHLDGDLDSHKHDSAFYETFHDMMQFVYESVYDVAYRTSQRIANKLVKNGLKIRAPMKKRYGGSCVQ